MVIALLLTVLMFWFRFDIERRVIKIQTNNSDFLSYSKAATSLNVLRGDFEKAKFDKQFLENILPQQDKLINLSRDLNGLAKQNNLQLSFSFGSQIDGTDKTPGYINFSMVIVGSLTSWIKFLGDFEKSRYLFSLDNFRISSNGRDHQLNINGKVFSQ